jgi:L-threonylcarbamoyladenylate synthase
MNALEFEDDLRRSLEVLQAGGSLLYPTDTVWGIGCDATDAAAVNRVYDIKQRIESKSLIVLVDSFNKISDYVEIVPEIAIDLINCIEKPVTIIYSHAKNLAPNVIASDGSIAIRVVREGFCIELIRRFGKPIVSTSANISGEPTPFIFNKIAESVKNRIDYIVRYKQDVVGQTKPSMIIRLHTSGEYEILRY